ncbi:MAG: hypothetical protein ACREVE_14300 [Gammaproteobacteria bacterium]
MEAINFVASSMDERISTCIASRALCRIKMAPSPMAPSNTTAIATNNRAFRLTGYGFKLTPSMDSRRDRGFVQTEMICSRALLEHGVNRVAKREKLPNVAQNVPRSSARLELLSQYIVYVKQAMVPFIVRVDCWSYPRFRRAGDAADLRLACYATWPSRSQGRTRSIHKKHVGQWIRT